MKLAALLFLVTTPALWGLDLRYTVVQGAGEGSTGSTYTYLRFTDGGDAVTYTPPRSWECSGSSDKLRLLPPQASQVDIDFHVCTLDTPVTIENSDPHVFETFARQSVPPGAAKIEIVSVAPALRIDGRSTIEVILSYSFYGGLFKASYLYLARGHDLLRFHVSGPPAGFDDYRATLHASLHTFAGLGAAAAREPAPPIAPRATVFARELKPRRVP